MKKVSLADVAKSLGVSKTLVSLVLNGRGNEKGISQNTQKRVHEKVKELKYKPNQFARGLRVGKSNTIGLVIADIANPFYAKLCRSIEDALNKKDYNLMICSTEENPEKESDLINMLIDRHVDGLIISTTQKSNDDIVRLMENKFPFVLIDRHIDDLETNQVIVDNEKGARNAVQHLIDLGHKEIGHLTLTPTHLSTIRDRTVGYENALLDNGIEVNHDLIKSIPFGNLQVDVAVALDELRITHPNISALFVVNNLLALAAMQHFSDIGLSIPDQVSIISFDDIEVFKLCSPPITAVSQPIDEMGKTACKILLSEINKTSNGQIQKVCLSTKLNKRKSCFKLS